MSLDYPFYEELRRRGHPAAKWWRLGDMLYYLGLLPAMLLAIPAIVSLVGLAWAVSKLKIWILALFVVSVAVFLVGTRCKLRSWRMAAKDGINVNNY